MNIVFVKKRPHPTSTRSSTESRATRCSPPERGSRDARAPWSLVGGVARGRRVDLRVRTAAVVTPIGALKAAEFSDAQPAGELALAARRSSGSQYGRRDDAASCASTPDPRTRALAHAGACFSSFLAQSLLLCAPDPRNEELPRREAQVGWPREDRSVQPQRCHPLRGLDDKELVVLAGDPMFAGLQTTGRGSAGAGDPALKDRLRRQELCRPRGGVRWRGSG